LKVGAPDLEPFDPKTECRSLNDVAVRKLIALQILWREGLLFSRNSKAATPFGFLGSANASF
jgi:hypothetical protein